MFHFLEYPWATEAGATNHDTIHSVFIEAFLGTLWGSDITVTNHSNAGITYTAVYSEGELEQRGVEVSLVGDATKDLESAVGKATDAAELIGKFNVQVLGTPNADSLAPTKIGAVTITISPAAS